MTDNPRNWQPPFEDDDEFWRRFEDSLNRAQGKDPNAPQGPPPPQELDDVFIPPEPPPLTAPRTQSPEPRGWPSSSAH